MTSRIDPRRNGIRPVPAQPTVLPSARRTLNVAVLDMVPMFRDGVAHLVERTPWLRMAGAASSQHGALQLVEQLHPDVVVLDSGLDPKGHLTQLLATGDPTMLVVSLVRDANRTPAYLATAIAAGVHAALPRSVEPKRLIDGIRHAHEKRRYIDPALAGLTATAGRPTVNKRGTGRPEQAPLSRREYQVLQLIAEGMENSAIAKTLFLSVETVRTHVKSILRKLAARDRTHAVTTAFRGGILVMQPDDGAVPPAGELTARRTKASG